MPVERQVALIFAGTNGYLDTIATSDLRTFETGLYQFIETRYSQLFRSIAEKKQLDDQLKGTLTEAVKEFAATFQASKATAA